MFEGVAANCASALAQMAAASCVQEEKDDKENSEHSDTITQGILFSQMCAAYFIFDTAMQSCKVWCKTFLMQPVSVHIGGFIVIKQL